MVHTTWNYGFLEFSDLRATKNPKSQTSKNSKNAIIPKKPCGPADMAFRRFWNFRHFWRRDHPNFWDPDSENTGNTGKCRNISGIFEGGGITKKNLVDLVQKNVVVFWPGKCFKISPRTFDMQKPRKFGLAIVKPSGFQISSRKIFQISSRKILRNLSRIFLKISPTKRS